MKTITETELKNILDQHLLWIETNRAQGKRADLSYADLTGAYLYGANLERANLSGANLYRANLQGAYLGGANLQGANLVDANLERANLKVANLKDANLVDANLKDAKDLPDISWIIPGCLAQLNKIGYGFYLAKEDKYENFVQDSFGFFIQNNSEEGTFDILAGDRIIRGIPDWVKYSGLKQAATESV